MKIDGVPDGYELVRIGPINNGESYLDSDGKVKVWDLGYSTKIINFFVVVRKAEKPKQYRPFANAEEFKPHREKWWKWIEDTSGVFPPASYNEFSHEDETWIDSFHFKVFEDGSPFGVEVSE
jgi:hypothetical protein